MVLHPRDLERASDWRVMQASEASEWVVREWASERASEGGERASKRAASERRGERASASAMASDGRASLRASLRASGSERVSEGRASEGASEREARAREASEGRATEGRATVVQGGLGSGTSVSWSIWLSGRQRSPGYTELHVANSFYISTYISICSNISQMNLHMSNIRDLGASLRVDFFHISGPKPFPKMRIWQHTS